MQIYSRRLPTIKQLQYFLAVCEENSFRKAAAKLGISQPPLSQQIKGLEEKLATNLLLRNTQQVILTEDGELFRIRAQALLKELCVISTLFKQDETQKIVLGMTKTLSFDFIPSFRNFFLSFKEGGVIYKNNYTSKELLSELKKKNLDFAVTSYYPLKEDLFHHQLIHQEPIILALPECHPASSKKLIDLNEVIDLPLYWFNRYMNPSYYDQCEQVFKSLPSPLVRRTELPDTLSMLLDISLGKGMLFMPISSTQAEIAGVVYKRFTPYFNKKFQIDIFLVWLDSSKNKDQAQSIIEYFKMD